MTTSIENETNFEFDFEYEELFRKITETVLDHENCPFDVSVSLFIVDDGAIKELNRDTRGIDRETDVLSFPLAGFSNPASFDCLEEDPDNFDPDTGELMLGDIVLSKDRILSQAEAYGHSVKREYAFLIVHSLLHLIGYDHIEEKDREIMEKEQKLIMERLGIPR